MARLPLPDLDILRQRFRYDPESGHLLCATFKIPAKTRTRDVERAAKWNAEVYGKPVGCKRSHCGYLTVGINGANYYVHRIAWKLVHGRDPSGDIDHINGNRTDNRLQNLREVTQAVNSRNKITSVRSASGVRGVYERGGRFIANVKVSGKIHHLGTFSSLEQAKEVRLAYDRTHGFTDRHLSR